MADHGPQNEVGTDKVEPHLPDDEKQWLEGLVTDLKLNYVEVTKTQQ